MQPLFRLRSLIHRDLLLGKVNREKQVVGVEWSSKSLLETRPSLPAIPNVRIGV